MTVAPIKRFFSALSFTFPFWVHSVRPGRAHEVQKYMFSCVCSSHICDNNCDKSQITNNCDFAGDGDERPDASHHLHIISGSSHNCNTLQNSKLGSSLMVDPHLFTHVECGAFLCNLVVRPDRDRVKSRRDVANGGLILSYIARAL